MQASSSASKEKKLESCEMNLSLSMRSIDLLADRLDLKNRQIGIDACQRATDRARDQRRILRSLHLQPVGIIVVLGELHYRQINHAVLLFARAVILRIPHNADDFPIALHARVGDFKALANGIALGKEMIRQRLIDNHDLSRSCRVVRINCAPPHHGHSHRLEITRSNAVQQRAEIFVGLRLMPGEEDRRIPTAAAHGRSARHRRRTNSRKRIETARMVSYRLFSCSGLYPANFALNSTSRTLMAIEAKILVLQISQSSHQQPRARQQHQ